VSVPTTVVKALNLLNFVADRPGLTLTEISRAAHLPAPTVHRLLRSLCAEGLVRLDCEHRYHLGSHCLALGSRFLESIDLRGEAQPHLEQLVERTGETAHLGVPEGTDVLYLAKVDTHHPVRMYSRIGARSPMHSTAMGKAILAFGDGRLVERVIDHGLVRRTPNTITDPDRFRSELDRTRARGYAIDDIENEDGIRCVGAPVLTDERHPVGAISASGPASRMTDHLLGDIAVAVMEVAREVAERLGYRKGAGVPDPGGPARRGS
jgi:DNA-binding IclR family transcriptional regulator